MIHGFDTYVGWDILFAPYGSCLPCVVPTLHAVPPNSVSSFSLPFLPSLPLLALSRMHMMAHRCTLVFFLSTDTTLNPLCTLPPCRSVRWRRPTLTPLQMRQH